jgi:hypothetical protein
LYPNPRSFIGIFGKMDEQLLDKFRKYTISWPQMISLAQLGMKTLLFAVFNIFFVVSALSRLVWAFYSYLLF